MGIFNNIFSVKNKDIYKVITVLGLKFKFKSNKLVIRSLKQDIKNLEDYITVQDNYAKVLEGLKEKIKTEPLNVIFLSNEPQKWSYDSLYRELEKSKYFNPIVLVYPRERTITGKDKSLMSVEEEYKFFKNKDINVDYWYKNNTFIDLKTFNPDIVFYTQLAELPEYDSPVKISEYALTCYCPYSYQLVDYKRHYLDNFHKFLWKYFVDDITNIDRFERYKKNNSKNCIYLGYPRLDIYPQNKDNKPGLENWKEPDKIKIIYAPHHSINKFSIFNNSTFLENGKFILELAKKYSDITTWIFKPHPMLKYQLINNGYMKEKEVDEYYEEWDKIGKFYNGGDYFDIFRSSDLMITDCISFLMEYLPTNHPLIRLSKTNDFPLNEFGEKVIRQYYYTYNNQELENQFIDLVINKNDYKKEKRQELISEIVDFNELSGSKIYNYLENIMKGNE